MYYLVRSHILPGNLPVFYIYNKYMKEFKKTQILMSEWDMNFWIRKTYSQRDSIMIQRTVVVKMSFEAYLDSVKHNNMVESWLFRRHKNNVAIMYQKTYMKTTCPICLELSGTFVQLDSCKCIFHEQCIKTSVRFSLTCPLCMQPIKEKKIFIKCNENVKDKMHTM